MSSTGVLEIKGTGNQPVSAILENTAWSGVELGSKDAKLTATGTTKIDNLTLKDDASIVTEGNAAISRVSLQQGLGKLLVSGSIGLLDASQYVGVPLLRWLRELQSTSLTCRNKNSRRMLSLTMMR